MAKGDVKSFTSWKLDWIDALTIGADAREFQIAACMIQHCNGETGLINPSQARIAHLLGCNVRSVERAVGKLVKIGALEKVRKSRNKSNQYRFIEQWKATKLQLKMSRDTEWRAMRVAPDPTDVTASEHAEYVLDPTDVTAPDPTDVTGKHLNETPARGSGRKGGFDLSAHLDAIERRQRRSEPVG